MAFRDAKGRWYRSVKVRGKTRKEYIGVGPAAEHLAELDRQASLVRQAEQAARRERKTDMEALEIELDGMDESMEQLARAAMLAAGYYEHCRVWRKRGGESDNGRKSKLASQARCHS